MLVQIGDHLSRHYEFKVTASDVQRYSLPPRLILMSWPNATVWRQWQPKKVKQERGRRHEDDDDFGRPSNDPISSSRFSKLVGDCSGGPIGCSPRAEPRSCGGSSGATGGAVSPFALPAGRRRAASSRCAISARFWSAFCVDDGAGCGSGGGAAGGGGAAARSAARGCFTASLAR